jgi:hypothetical protein
MWLLRHTGQHLTPATAPREEGLTLLSRIICESFFSTRASGRLMSSATWLISTHENGSMIFSCQS